ncbi:Na+/H+ antiporter family [Fusobacterium necrophorum subsp. necrophorum]|nr:Na+/H+ antiporter family [Fusobacterium necrophorum subsp. necrophorum]
MQSTVILLAAAAALGDAGSPASDTTLGPTSGLNADGQHEHIWDTCFLLPTFQCSFDYWSYDWFHYDLWIEFKYHLDVI